MDLSQQVNIKGFPIEDLSVRDVEILQKKAAECRSMAVKMTTVANSGHPAGSLSSMEMYLMAYGVADITPLNCNSIDRDFLVISHGHTSPGAYSVLSCYGFMDQEDVVSHFRQAGSPYQGHVEREVPGIDWGSGNLGQGLSAGTGYALSQKIRGYDGHVFVLGSDGEQTKGQIAEARRMAVSEELNNITVLLDWNHIQISGRTDDIMPADLHALWEADGWHVMECDGHSVSGIYQCMRDARLKDKPVVIFCHTTMGKGVAFMEGVPDYHGKAATGDNYKRALSDLGDAENDVEKYLEKRNSEKLPEGRKIDPFETNIDTGVPVDYKSDEITDNRSAFGKALADIGSLNYLKDGRTPLVVFDCDLAGSVKTSSFEQKCPQWFIEAGIQEHSVATCSGASSLGGIIPFWADFGVFGLSEVYNQQRLNDINGTNLKLALTHVGLDVGEDGMTHQCIDYVGLMRNMFGWKLVVPADPNQTDRLVRWMTADAGNICIAMGRSKVPVLTDEEGRVFFTGDYTFEYGKYDLLRNGEHGAIMAMGCMVPRAVEAASILKREGFSVKVYNVSCPLEIDEKALADAAETGFILTLEDHNEFSGMGSVIASYFGKNRSEAVIEVTGVSRYGQSGRSDEVLDNMGLSVDHIVERIKRIKG